MVKSHWRGQLVAPDFNAWAGIEKQEVDDFSAAARFVGEHTSEFLMLFHYAKKNDQIYMVNNTMVEPHLARQDPRFAVLAFMAELAFKNGICYEVWEYVALHQLRSLPKQTRVTDHIVDFKEHDGPPRWTAPEYMARPLESDVPGLLLRYRLAAPVYYPTELVG